MSYNFFDYRLYVLLERLYMKKYTLLLLSIIMVTTPLNSQKNSSSRSYNVAQQDPFSISVTTNSIDLTYSGQTAQELINIIQEDLKKNPELSKDKSVKNFLNDVLSKLKSPSLTSYSQSYYYKSSSYTTK